MKADSGYWIVMGPAATPVEQKALDTFRETLPEDGITTAWVNLTFIDNNGRSAEVDVLLLTRSGLYVMELKGWHGTIEGDSQRWTHGRRNVESPLLATDRKAKRLAEVLKGEARGGPQERDAIPFLQPKVVLHGHESTVDLNDLGRTGVMTLDGYTVKAKPSLPRLSAFLAETPSNPHHLIDFQRAKQIRKIAERAGFRAAPKVRMVGDYQVADSTPVAEGPDWQDVLVDHPHVRRLKLRLRLYDLDPKAPKNDRTRIEHQARREFELTLGIRHDGIAVPSEFKMTDDGPALVFDYDEAELPLDAYLGSEAGLALDFEQRVALVQRLGETLRFAHQRHLIHRALSPRRVWVRPRKGELPVLTIRDWYFGQKEHSSEASSRWTVISAGVTDLLGIANHEDWLYFAPEARHDARNLPGIPLDVYGLGALGYLILTGSAPAESFGELEQKLAEIKALDPRAAATVPDEIADVITLATGATETDRPASVQDVLDDLQVAWDQVRRPDEGQEPTEVEDPLEAAKGDIVGDRFIVAGRRGEGSSGVALAVNDTDSSDGDREVILKIARTEAADSRMSAEAEVLRAIDHRRIVKLLAGPLEVDGRKALLLTDAGKETLGKRLSTEGRSTLGQLQVYGGDLLEAMAYLESKGVFHRDVKPANLGIIKDPGTKIPRLILFDFSLSTEGVDNLGSGTPGYLDPFLGRGRRQLYDRAAELYAVSATLFEMATGSLPWWEGGASGPTNAKDAPVIEPTSFEPAIALQLTELFKKALNPEVKQRFASAAELALSWQQIFIELDAEEETAEASDALAEAATRETLLASSGLSTKARSLMARLDLVTVDDLLGVPVSKITTIRGIGEVHRKEIQRRIKQWRARLSATEETGGEQSPGIERTVALLLDPLGGEDRAVLRAVLGLTEQTAEAQPTWPALTETAQSLGRTRDQVAHTIDHAAEVWGRKSGVLQGVCDEVVEILARGGRISTLPSLAWALAARRGSLLDGAERARQAAALLRAAFELDSREFEPRLEHRRRPKRPDLIALSESADPDETGLDFPTAETLISAADELGRQAEALAVRGVTPLATAAEILRDAVADAGGETLPQDDRRFLTLAADASGTADISGFGELYPRILDPVTAIELALAGKPDRQLHEAAIRRSVASRFPQVQLPAAASGLDALVAKALPGLVRHGSIYEPASTSHHSVTGTTTMLVPTKGPEASTRLSESLNHHGALTVCTTPRRYVAAAKALATGFDLEVLDVAEMVVTATKETALDAGADWPFVLGVDAGPKTGEEWETLSRIVHAAVEPVLAERLKTDRPLLITNAGPLIRYGLRKPLDNLLDVGTPRPAARWLLVAMNASQPAPQLEDRPAPVGPSGWITLPSDLTGLAALTH